jgi:hypothetical protein
MISHRRPEAVVYEICVSLFLLLSGQIHPSSIGHGLSSAFLLSVSNQRFLPDDPASRKKCLSVNLSSLCSIKSKDDVIDLPNEDDSSNTYLLASLKARELELRQGIGKRFVTRTQRGFLNVHDAVSSSGIRSDTSFYHQRVHQSTLLSYW